MTPQPDEQRESGISAVSAHGAGFSSYPLRSLYLKAWIAALALLLTLSTAVLGEKTGTGAAFKGYEVSSVEIRGLDDPLVSQLKKGLVLSGRHKLFRTQKAIFYPQILLDDIDRCRLFLARNGFPYAGITSRLEPSHTEHRVDVILIIEAGRAVQVQEVFLEQFPDHLLKQARASVISVSGSIFSEERFERTARSLEDLLRAAGYARAGVEGEIGKLDSTHVTLHFRANPGTSYRMEDVVVDGASEDLVPIVRKIVNLRRGVTYSPSLIREADEDVRLLELFRQIRVDVSDADPGMLNLRIDLVERKPRVAEIGLGYWTDDLFRAHARWMHRNLFRGGRGLEVKGSFSRFKQDGGVSAWWPALLGSRTRGIVKAEVEKQREESYELLSVGIGFSVNYRYSPITLFRSGITISKVNLDEETEDPEAFVEEGGLLTFLSFGWQRNNLDDRVFPTKGTVMRTTFEWTPPGPLSKNYFASAETGAVAYSSIGSSLVVAGRLGLGLAAPTSGSIDLLPNKRFFAGGASSMRGFRRRKLGPHDDAGAPLGGEAKIEASMEIRFPVIWRLKGALFIDSGQVWRQLEDVSLGQMEAAAGPGLRVKTPVGPVRTDLAYRITDRQTGEPRWVFHLSVGYPY